MKALYAGTFDPFTLGHLDIVKRAKQIFQELTIGVAVNANKNCMFSIDERLRLIRRVLVSQRLDIAVTPVQGLVADFCYINGFTHLIKGARTAQDFDYERIVHDVTLTQQRLETVLLFSAPELSHVSSSVAKELVRHKGLVHTYVPLLVKQALEWKNSQLIIGVTGTIGSGKSTLCRALVGTSFHTPIHHINVDELALEIREGTTALSNDVRNQILQRFGTVSRAQLGEIVFKSPEHLHALNEIYREPLLTMLRQALYAKNGIILLEGALLVELNWLSICNNNVVLVQEPESTQHRARLLARGMSEEAIGRRLSAQYDFKSKLAKIEEAIAQNSGCIIHYDSSKDILFSTQQVLEKIETLSKTLI